MKIHDPKLTGSIEIQTPIPGISPLTASWAQNVVGGGPSGQAFPYTGSAQITGSLGVTGSVYVTQRILVNATDSDLSISDPEALLVSGSSINVISGKTDIDSYVQLNILNTNTGTQVSSDIVATNDTGDESGNYVDLGINGSNFTGLIGGPNDAYLYTTGSQFVIGNQTRGANAQLKLFAGNDATVFPVVVTGSNAIITGSLLGTASFSTTASFSVSSSIASTASYARNGFPYSGSQAQITGALSISGSLALWPTLDPDSAGSNSSTAYFFVSQSQYSDPPNRDLYYRNAGYLWSQDYLQQAIDTGIIYGGIVTFTSSLSDTAPNATEVRVTPGIGLLIDHNAFTGSKGETTPAIVKFGPITQSFKNEITSSQVHYLYIDQAGTFQYQTTTFNTEQYHTQFPLGVIFSLTTSSISSFGDLRVTAYGQTQQAGEFVRAFGPLKESGFDISPISTTLSASIASGKAFRFGGFYTQNPETPSTYVTSAVPTASFVRVYRDPVVLGGYRAQVQTNGAPYRAIDPTKYDDGSGTLQSVGSGEFTIQRLFQGVVNSVTYVYYGQNKYTSLTNALNSITTEDFAESQTSIVTLPFIGYVIVEGTATSLADTNTSRIINAGLFRNTAGSSGGGGAAVTNLNDLGDVIITSPSNGQALVYSTGNWVNGDPTSEFPYTGSAAISGSLRVVGPSSITGSLVISASSDIEEFTVIGQATVTGSLIVSGSGGYGVFSKGITLADLTNGFTVTGSYFVWRSPFPCRVVSLYAIHSGSGQLSVNARRSGSGASLHLASNLNVNTDNAWSGSTTVQNTDYSAGDSLEIIVSGSNQIQASVQVDFIKR